MRPRFTSEDYALIASALAIVILAVVSVIATRSAVLSEISSALKDLIHARS